MKTIRCNTSHIQEPKREGVQTAVLSIAIPLGEGSAHHIYDNGVLYAFLPTMQNPRLPFLIHSDFILVPSRDSIMGSRAWNEYLLQQVPILFSQMANEGMKDLWRDFWRVFGELAQVRFFSVNLISK